uniref:SpoU_methylase domain-containing protein n=1 Tax=Syphacia muris TaxID=451379 RepID=A0A0N5AF03_9BILA
MEETVKIASGKCKSDRTLDRGIYNSGLAKIISANDEAAIWKKKQQHRWIPAVKGQIVYGIYPVLEALKAHRREVHKLYYKPNLMWMDSINRREHLESILSIANSDGITSKELEGICIDAEPLQFLVINNCTKSDFQGPIVFFDNVLVKDTFNIGAIVRSCAFFGIKAVVMAQDAGPKAITPAMSRASAGTVEWLPMYKVTNPERFLQEAKSQGYVVIGTFDESSLAKQEQQNVVPVEELKSITRNKKFILVLGNEHKGISNAISHQCQYVTFIRNPSRTSIVNSLNVSAATAILLHYLQM